MEENCTICGEHANIMSFCDNCENIVCLNHICMAGSDGVCTNCLNNIQPRENLNNNNRDKWLVDEIQKTHNRMDVIEDRVTSIKSDLAAILDVLTTKK